MATTFADELLARFANPAPPAYAQVASANPANPAKTEHPCGLAEVSEACEGLRVSANPVDFAPAVGPGSQPFAAFRNRPNGPVSEQACGSSQNSQRSQSVPAQCASADLATFAWTDADIGRFLARRDRLLRWGWAEAKAEALAERLVRRDRDGDDRRACVECVHLENTGRCAWARMGRLAGADRRLEPVPAILQRCSSFMPIHPDDKTP